MNENLNLVELLKDVPRGTSFHHSVHGKVSLREVCCDPKYPIELYTNDSMTSVTSGGLMYIGVKDADCVLFPSKEQRDWGLWAKEQEDKKKQLLPVDTPVMVDANGGETLDYLWTLRYYAESNKCFNNGAKSTDEAATAVWKIIIPFDKFDPNNIEESLKHNIIELYDTQKRKIGRPQTSVSQI